MNRSIPLIKKGTHKDSRLSQSTLSTVAPPSTSLNLSTVALPIDSKRAHGANQFRQLRKRNLPDIGTLAAGSVIERHNEAYGEDTLRRISMDTTIVHRDNRASSSLLTHAKQVDNSRNSLPLLASKHMRTQSKGQQSESVFQNLRRSLAPSAMGAYSSIDFKHSGLVHSTATPLKPQHASGQLLNLTVDYTESPIAKHHKHVDRSLLKELDTTQ